MNLTIATTKVTYRKAYVILMIFFLAGMVSLPAAAQNMAFVQQDAIKVSGVTTSSQLVGLTAFEKQTTRTYVGGLGQPVQDIAIKASPLMHDIIQPHTYDATGRETTQYLPYTGTDGSGNYRPNALTTEQAAFYNNGAADKIADDTKPYSSRLFDDSPLQLLLTSGMVGDNFQPGQHAKVFNYRSNNAGDGNIMVWDATGTNVGNYSAGKLSVAEATDEDLLKVATFTNFAGRTVLKRQYTSTAGVYVDTYYIYNNAGMLSYVIPPKALAIMVANGSYSLTQTGVNTLIFHYIYDNQGRIIQKTVPGAGPVNMIYDPLNRVVLTQDAKMGLSYKWYYIKYDGRSHPISQGTFIDASHSSAATLQNSVNTAFATTWYETRNGVASTGYYTNACFPTIDITPLAYSYYDNYDMSSDNTTDYSKADQGLTNEQSQTTDSLRGVLTMVRKAPVGAGISINMYTYLFYDSRGHIIQTRSNNQTSSTVSDLKTVVYDFTGAPIQTKVTQVNGSTTTTVLTTPTYDHMHRTTAVDQKYNTGGTIRIAAYMYNELGQLVNKGLGQVGSGAVPPTLTLSGTYAGTQTMVASTSITFSGSPAGTTIPSGSTFKAYISTGYLQLLDYRYNIRGQLLSMNNSKLTDDGGLKNSDGTDLFGMELLYDNADANLGDTARYDGRLAGIKWMSMNASGTKSYERSYSYGYDALSRLTSAKYAERTQTSTGVFNNNIGGFDESGIKYDVNGNILGLNRNSSTQGTNTHIEVDALNYTYSTANPNQLLKVSDVTDANHTGYGFRNLTAATVDSAYTYDVNGNLLTDPYKGLGLYYNDLNKTDKIKVRTATNRFINYTYDASGVLLRKQVYDNNVLQTTTDYIDGFVYINNTLSYFAMPEGRVVNVSGTLKPEYIIGDQQGNARISFQESATVPGTAVVTQENSYYGFGLIMPNSQVSTPTNDNKNLYNGGSEWQNDYSNLPDYYQTYYRNYDAALGRFIAVDPMPESAESMSVYHYAGNNPITYNDPNGDYQTNPFSPGFNQQVGNVWTNSNVNMGPTAGELDPNLNYGGAAGAGDNIFYYQLLAAAQGGSAEAWQQYAALKGGNNIYKTYGNGKSTGVSKGSLRDYMEDIHINGIDPTGVTMLAEVTIREAGWKIQAEAYGSDYYGSDNRGAPGYVPAGGTTGNWYDIGSKANSAWGIVTAFLKSSLGYVKSGRPFLKYYSSGWKGGSRAFIRTVESARVAGWLGFAAGELMDIFAYNSSDPEIHITGTKALVNLGFGVVGLVGKGYGTAVAAGYFVIDAYYPGGWGGLGNDLKNYGQQLWNTTMQGISKYNSGFGPW